MLVILSAFPSDRNDCFELEHQLVDCQVAKNRALHVLREIAGIYRVALARDPGQKALSFLKAHGVDRPLQPFLIEGENVTSEI